MLKKCCFILTFVAFCLLQTAFLACSPCYDYGCVDDDAFSRVDTLYIYDSVFVFDSVVSNDTFIKIDSVYSFDTIFKKDSIFFKDTVYAKDTLVVNDSIVFKDTIYSKDTVVVKDSIVIKDTIYSKDTVLKYKDKLSGKVWFSCGDSFTHGDFTGYEGDDDTLSEGKYAGRLCVYPYIIGNNTDCDVLNMAVNGLTLAYVNGQGFTAKETGLLYTTDFSKADYVTLYFGINDSHKSVPIGSIDDNVNTTFYGALNVAIEYLTTNYPRLKIGLICSNGCDSPDYPEATKQAAIKWGVPYLDIDGGVGCPTMLRCSSRNPASAEIKALRLSQQRVSSTNAHPNPMAHRLEAEFIEDWLKSL